MGTVTKRNLVAKVSDQTSLSQQTVFKVMQAMLTEITDSLSTGDDVVLRRFGSFQVMQTKPKIGRNPKRPETTIEIPARSIVKFKPGKTMKERVSKLDPE